MAKHTFHLSPHASTPLYNFISSPRVRVILLFLTLLDIFLFAIGIGLAAKYIPYQQSYWDLGIDNRLCQKVALGFMFLPFTWLVFLLVWHELKKPKLHPGYYVGFDLYVGVSTITTLATVMTFSPAVVLQSKNDACGWDDEPVPSSYKACMQHVKPIEYLNIVAYSLGFIIAIILLVLFGNACHVCKLYNREKAVDKVLQKRGMRLESPNDSTSRERINQPAGNGAFGSSGDNAVLESRMV